MSEQTQNVNEEQKAPTKDQVMEFLKEQIDVKKLQLELQQLNTGLATNRAEELKALSFIAQLTNPRQDENAYRGAPDGTPHKITQEDLDNNPELVEAGVEVGDDVIIPNQESEPIQEPTSKKLKKN